jgi:Na+/H+ antiporter NhaC
MSKRAQWIAVAAFLVTFFLLPLSFSGAVSIWPSVLAIALAFITRNIYVSLFVGAFAGAVLLSAGNPFTAFLALFEIHLLPSLSDPWNISVLVFTLMMGGLVELLNVGGGMQALATRLLRGSETKRRAGLGVYGLGWVLFIDGLANAMLVGKSMRPITDRVGISREKLAFIVDSTSSPIAGLSLISTWVAYELSVIQQGFANAGQPDVAVFPLLVQSLPFRFYNVLLLLIVFLVIWYGRDIGEMRAAEAKSLPTKPQKKVRPADGPVWPVIVCLATLIIGVFAGLYFQGGGTLSTMSFDSMIAAFGKANAALVFVWATAGTVVLAMVLNRITLPKSEEDSVVKPFFDGMNQMFLPTIILVFAWTLNSVIKEMGAAKFLVSLLSDSMTPGWLPAATFLLGAVISFSTGTSWGTMAILMPLVIPVAVGMPDGAATILVPTIGAVLAGAVFGDHCSPISDTTIVSAVSSDCDPMAHVRTQLPYAMLAAGVAVFLGYLPSGWGANPWVALFFASLVCWAIVRFMGEPATRA